MTKSSKDLSRNEMVISAERNSLLTSCRQTFRIVFAIFVNLCFSNKENQTTNTIPNNQIKLGNYMKRYTPGIEFRILIYTPLQIMKYLSQL